MYKVLTSPKPVKISKWLGINESVGETEIALGECVRQVNWRITKDYKLQKRPGHKTFIDYDNSKDVQGIWEGHIDDKHVIISCNDGKVYEYNFDTQINSQIGTITDTKTTIFYFGSKLYFLNGVEYKEYDGTTFQDVVPYIPTLYVALFPSGAVSTDNLYEDSNLLTGTKKVEYTSDGTATLYVLPEKNIDYDAVVVTINEVSKTEGTHFMIDRINGTLDFSKGTSPNGAPTDKSLVRIQYTKVTSGNADLVKKNRYAMLFGPGNDTAVFLWGNPDAKNRRTWSGTLKANYFPAFNFTLIGSDEYAITDIKAQNANYQIIFKEDRTHYSYANYISEKASYDYPVFDLNEKVGNVTYNAVQIVQNNPVSICGKQWWVWTGTNVEDERNADPISSRLNNSLSSIDLRTAITFDYQSEQEYWCNVDDKVYIWNYGNNTMYTYNNISATCFLDIDGELYYGSHGTLEHMEGIDDNGVAIAAQADTGHHSIGTMQMIKTSDTAYIGIMPYSQTSVTICFRTNKISEFKKINKIAEYRLLDWNNIDFNHFTFKTNRNPQTIPLRLNSREYTTIQFRFENIELNETCVLLEFIFESEVQGEV